MLTQEKTSDRSSVDDAVRRILFIHDNDDRASDDSAHRIFSTSITISALRCLLSYVIFPIVTPLVGASTNVGPAIGIPIALLALVFDVRGIRRFWLAEHKWRWLITVIYLAVMILVTVLLIGDLSKIF